MLAERGCLPTFASNRRPVAGDAKYDGPESFLKDVCARQEKEMWWKAVAEDRAYKRKTEPCKKFGQ